MVISAILDVNITRNAKAVYNAVFTPRRNKRPFVDETPLSHGR